MSTNETFVLVKEAADNDGWFIYIYIACGVIFFTDKKAEINYLFLFIRNMARIWFSFYSNIL